MQEQKENTEGSRRGGEGRGEEHSLL